eukprot:jgi/Chrzof1/4357/Cz14g10060.t1
MSVTEASCQVRAQHQLMLRVWVHSTRTCRALTRADVRGEAKQTDRRTYETVSELTVTAPHLLVASKIYTPGGSLIVQTIRKSPTQGD